MLVLAPLSLPVADVEVDLDGAGDPLVAKRRDLDHQRILVRKQHKEGALSISQTQSHTQTLPECDTHGRCSLQRGPPEGLQGP